MSARRRALLLLALLLVGGAGLSAAGRVAVKEEAMSIADLPWRDTDAPATVAQPGPLLYVQASCPHCARAARFADSLRRARALTVHIVAGDGRADADAFAARAGVTGRVIADSARSVARAAGIRAVPTLLVPTADGRVRRIVGAELPELRKALLDTDPRQ